MSTTLWIALVACVAASYIGACNLALIHYSKKRLADLLDERGQNARLRWLSDHVQGYTLMTGVLRMALNMFVLLAILYDIESRGLFGWGMWNYLVAFAIAGAAISLFAIAIPASWAEDHAEFLLARSLPILRACYIVFQLFSPLLQVFDPVVRRIAGTDLSKKEDYEISDEVLFVVEDHDEAGNIDETQKDMLEAVFELPTTDVAEIMTPRTEVHGIEIDATLEAVKAAVIEFGHSRIPVYEKNLDHILGILYVKDLIHFVGDPKAFNLRQVLREPFLVPESKKVHQLLAEFKARKVHLAIILDEYGGMAGLVTIEDILEEIVGEIQDEYEQSETEPEINRVDVMCAEVDARVRIDELNDELDLKLPEDEDYDTVGGFVTSQLGHIPEPDESFEFDQCRFTILKAERTRVLQLRVEKLETQPTRGD